MVSLITLETRRSTTNYGSVCLSLSRHILWFVQRLSKRLEPNNVLTVTNHVRAILFYLKFEISLVVPASRKIKYRII